MGVSKESIERNVLEPMREIYTDKLIGNIRANDNIAMICGEPVYCLGAEKASQVAKIQGMSVKYCYGDEVAKWNREVFKMLQSRLDKPYSCFDGSLNPESPSHWLKKEFLDKEDIDAYVQHYRIFDNPFLPKSFIANLCKEYEGTVFYDRYIEGRWTNAEGLIYPHYKEAIASCPYILTEQSFTDIDDFRISIDYGTLNAFACLLWVKYKGTWWAWRGYYYSGRETGVQLTDSEYADEVCKLVAPVMNMQAKLYKEFKIDNLGRIRTYVDPSASSFITELDKRQLFKVEKALNDVSDGIRATNTAIRFDLIKINDTITEWADEAGGYIWDEKAPDDRPVKVNDHCLVGDTLVDTETGQKPIKDMVGTSGKVWSFNPITGQKELKPYKDCRMTQKKARILKITCEDGRVIRCTEEHPILTQRGWALAMYLESDDRIIDIHVGNVKIKSRLYDGFEDVYNMEVEDNHNYSIEGGLIVHNCMDATRYFVATEGLVDKNEQTYNDEELKKMYDPRNEYQDDYTGGIF